MIANCVRGINDGFLFFDEISGAVKIDTILLGFSQGITDFTNNHLTKIAIKIERETVKHPIQNDGKLSSKFIFPRNIIDEGIYEIAFSHPRNLFLERIMNIKWDGKPRISTFLSDCGYCSGLVDPDEDLLYTRVVSETIFKATIDRQVRHKVQIDFIPILVGTQGVGKSTLCKKLGFLDEFDPAHVDDEFYKSYCESDVSVQKVHEHTKGGVIVELQEVVVFGCNENKLKALFDQYEYQYRKPYDKEPMHFPIKHVYIGTTNQDTFLSDLTGNRRFYPVEYNPEEVVTSIKDMPLSYIGQCWAEAYVRYHQERNWKEDLIQIQSIAKQVQDRRTARPTGYYELMDALYNGFTVGSLIAHTDLNDLIGCLDLPLKDGENLRKFVKNHPSYFGLETKTSPFKDSKRRSVRGWLFKGKDGE